MLYRDRREMVPCKWCGNATHSTGTKMCDPCWELDHRIRDEPALSLRIANHYQTRHVRRWGFKSRTQLPLFMVWEETWYAGEVIYAKVLFSTHGLIGRTVRRCLG